MKRFLFTSSLLLAGISASHAAITYIDATASNTTTANSSAYSNTANAYADNLWTIRTLTAADAVNATIFEAGPQRTGGEDVPVLTTVIGSLTPNQSYNVYAYFIANLATQPWPVQAGLSAGTMSLYTRVSAGATQLAAGSSTALFNPGGSAVTVPTAREYFQANLGTVTADASGNISVFIDAPSTTETNDSNFRTWYDGVGFQAVPEPSAAVFGLLGMTAFLRRRR